MDQEQEVKYIASALRRLNALADKFHQALIILEQYQQIDDVIRELTQELPRDIDRIYEILLVILDKLDDQRHNKLTEHFTAELRQDAIKARIRSLQRQKKMHQDNKNLLEEQAALHGASPPINITTQIIWEKERIREIEEELTNLRRGIVE